MRGMVGSCSGFSGLGLLNKLALLTLFVVLLAGTGCKKSTGTPYVPPPCGYCEVYDEAALKCVWNCGDQDPDVDTDNDDSDLDTDKPTDGDDIDNADTEVSDDNEGDSTDGETAPDGDTNEDDACFGGECDFDHDYDHCECQQDTECGPNETCGADCKCHNKCQCQTNFDCINEGYVCGLDCKCHLKIDGDQEEESTCQPCNSHADCSGGAFCRPIANDSEEEGDGDAAGEGEETAAPLGCCDNTYAPPCRTNKNCPYAPQGTGSYCDPQEGICVFDCINSSECGDLMCCNCHGECVAQDECECAETVDGDFDMNCSGCEDCSWRGAGYYCNSLTGLCTEGGQCCKNSDCPADNICNTQNGECMVVVPPKQGSISGTIYALKEMAGNAFDVILLSAPYPDGVQLAHSGGLYLQVNGDQSSVSYSLTGLSEDNYYAYARSVASASTQIAYTYNPIAISYNSPAQQYRTGINFYLYVENPTKASIQGTIHLAPQYAANSVHLTLWYENSTGLMLAGNATSTPPTSGDPLVRPFSFFNVTDTGSRAYYYMEARMPTDDTDFFDWYSSPIEIKDLAKDPGYKATGKDIYFGDEVENTDLGSLQGVVFLNGFFDWNWTFNVYLYTTPDYLFPVAQAKMNGNPFSGYSYRFANIEGLHYMDGTTGPMTYYVRAVAKSLVDGTTYYGLPAEGYEYFDVEEGQGVNNDYTRNLTVSQPPTGR